MEISIYPLQFFGNIYVTLNDMDNNMENGKEIKLRRALILGNFYNQKVRINKMINGVQEAVIDVIVGIQTDVVLTKSGVQINKNDIRSIYQI